MKVEGLITYATNQLMFKIKVNSAIIQEVSRFYIDFHCKWIKDAIIPHMGFYVTTENPNVMMRGNHNTQSCEYLIICQD